uniref:LYR motif-containing protein 4-like n=1 Tax=Styela clava TaxID=7725 RepID=UPI00193A897C|nr:LYR motif-containing protein 4-like [Styela clava]
MSKGRALQLYKALLKESSKFSDYNFRHYAITRTKDAFRANKSEPDPVKIQDFLHIAQKNLEMIERQVTIGEMFRAERLIIDNDS